MDSNNNNNNNGSEESRGSTGIKTQMWKMDLRTRGGGRVTWDKVREWHGLIYTTKCKMASGKSRIAQGDQVGAL